MDFRNTSFFASRRLLALFAWLGAIGLVACSSRPTISSVDISPSTVSLKAGETKQLRATVIYSDRSSEDVTASARWTSNNTLVATLDEASAGKVTALSGGESRILATYEGFTGAAKITVEGVSKELKSLSITPAIPQVVLGTTIQLTATGTFGDNSTADLSNAVTWASSDTSIATVSGRSLTGVAIGTAKVTAALNGIETEVSITVFEAQITAIDIEPTTTTIAKGTTRQLAAIGRLDTTGTQDLTSIATWQSSNTDIATVDSRGLLSAVSGGQVTITATYKSVVGTLQLTVSPALITRIELLPTTPTIIVNATQSFAVTAFYDDSTSQSVSPLEVTWQTSNGTVASISSQGVATGLKAGATTISATYNGKSTSTTLTVKDATLTAITISAASTTIAKTTTTQFTAMGKYSDNSTKDVTSQVLWASSSMSVASISNAVASKGLATGVGVGTSAITATYQTATSAAVALTVSPAPLSSIALSPASVSLEKGVTQQFFATGTYADGNMQDITTQVTWTSSQPSVATISNLTGTSGVATAKTPGTTSITVSLGSTFSSPATLTVLTPTLQAIVVTPSTATINVNSTQPFTATGFYSDGSQSEITTDSSISWSSSSQSVATISNFSGSRGIAMGKAAGTTTISATMNSITSSGVTLQVNAPTKTLTSIAVSPLSASINRGATLQYSAIGTYSDTSTADITSSVVWNASDSSLVSFSTSGLATASSSKSGSVSVWATINSISSPTATLTVLVPTLTSIAITPTNATIALNGTLQFTATGTYSAGSPQDITNSVTWTSFNTGVATISSSGLATGWASGTTTIQASLSAKFATTDITVLAGAPTLTSIAVTPSVTSIAVGGTAQFTATGTYSDGSTANITNSVTWSTTDASSAKVTVSATGLATGIEPTIVNITATWGSVSNNTAQIKVGGAPPACHPLINEVQPGQLGAANSEWIEIFNPCATDFDMTGWKVFYRSSSGRADVPFVTMTPISPATAVTLPAGGYFIVANKSGTGYAGYADFSYTQFSMAGANPPTGGAVALASPSAIIDAVGYGTATNAYVRGLAAPYSGDTSPARSFMRSPNGADSSSNSADFKEGSASYPPTPGSANYTIP